MKKSWYKESKPL